MTSTHDLPAQKHPANLLLTDVRAEHRARLHKARSRQNGHDSKGISVTSPRSTSTVPAFGQDVPW
ncbi:hypothetical protein GCM10022267_91300 [Lentzea roselyniae]|uniref:Uncharacterized protein n=1 Tax=Lentzea roselyniae TaxID=531940 RepID=A0ABP7CHG2_9PSEU